MISYLKAAFKLALQSKMLKYLIIFLRDHEPVPWVKTSIPELSVLEYKNDGFLYRKNIKSNISDGTLALTDVDK